MRISQLATLIEQADPDKIYVVGDSHAVAVAANIPNAQVLAQNGATVDQIATQAQSVPDGVRVLITGGANDWSSHAQGVGATLNRILRTMKNRGVRSVYVAFPKIDLNGVHREVYAGAGYTSNYDRVQTATARAAQSVLGGEYVISLQMNEINPRDPMRIHATPQAYSRVAAAANQKFTALGTGQQSSPNENLDPQSIRVDVDALEPEDQELLDLDGDGIVTVADTEAAGIQPDQLVDGGAEFFGIFSVLSNFINKQRELTYTPELRSVLTDLRNRQAAGTLPTPRVSGGGTQNARSAMQFFERQGLTQAQAAGVVGNLQAESGINLNPAAIGDGGAAWGIAQWHPDRRKIWEDANNKTWQADGTSPGFAEQLQFIIYELNRTESRALSRLRATETAADAARVFDQYYERSSGAHRERRVAYAEALMGASDAGTATADASGIPTNGNPLFGLDGSQSRMTQRDAATEMEQTLARYRRLVSNLGFQVRINDAIARAGTSRESDTPGSQHFHGTALDLSIAGLSDRQKRQLVAAAKAVGFTGFGFGSNILHVDSGPARSWNYDITTFAGLPVQRVQSWATA